MPSQRGRPRLEEGDKKKQVTVRLDADLVAKLKSEGKGWTTRINQILRQELGLDK